MSTSKLSNADFRFVSAWIQGVDVLAAWDRYQAHRGSGDTRRIRTTTRDILDRLAAIAKRHGDPTAAALLRRDPARIKVPKVISSTSGPTSSHPVMKSSVSARNSGTGPTPMPTLAEFAASLPDPDFYSERELVALLEERYGKVASLRPKLSATEPGDPSHSAPGRRRLRDLPELMAARRRGRLVSRQLDIVRRLEALAASTPVPEDATDAWLDTESAKRLGQVGVLKLYELMFFIRLHGYRWYRKVPRLGEVGAGRLVRWLRQHEETLGPVAVMALAPLSKMVAYVTEPAPATGVVPIERLRLPSTLNGASGTNRAAPERCRARARNDYAAVMEWLELRRPTGETGNAHTFRAYRKEAERFLLWSVFERHKALSSLDHVDCIEYRRFLALPSPAWVGAKSVPRWSEHWRPFEGPLGLRSRKAAEAVVTTMCAWLAEVRYLDSNPWTQVPRLNRPLPLQDLRSLSDKQWDLVKAWLKRLPQTPANDRLRMMFSLALATGMREAELANARAGWLRQEVDEQGETAWNLIVVGKGSKERELPLTGQIAEQLAAHMEAKGFGRDLAELAPGLPLLSGLPGVNKRRKAAAVDSEEELLGVETAMAPERVYELMKAAFRACADWVEEDDPKAAERIRRASPHWLRHTLGRKWVEAGGDRGALRDFFGHASIATTGIYDRSATQFRRREVEKVLA